MAHFAALALLRRVILTMAVIVAAHHIGFNYLLPMAVFSDESGFDWGLLHTAILSRNLDLIWVIHSLGRIFAVPVNPAQTP